MFVKTKVSSKGQIVLPAERLDGRDHRLVRRAAPPNEGVIDWLLACPHKGYFARIESESADLGGFRR
jgi:hypothetical protein